MALLVGLTILMIYDGKNGQVLQTDGIRDQVLQTDGIGTLSWKTL